MQTRLTGIILFGLLLYSPFTVANEWTSWTGWNIIVPGVEMRYHCKRKPSKHGDYMTYFHFRRTDNDMSEDTKYASIYMKIAGYKNEIKMSIRNSEKSGKRVWHNLPRFVCEGGFDATYLVDYARHSGKPSNIYTSVCPNEPNKRLKVEFKLPKDKRKNYHGTMIITTDGSADGMFRYKLDKNYTIARGLKEFCKTPKQIKPGLIKKIKSKLRQLLVKDLAVCKKKAKEKGEDANKKCYYIKTRMAHFGIRG